MFSSRCCHLSLKRKSSNKQHDGGSLSGANQRELGARQVMDALKMDWPDDSFDLVWACESGEHMPDKKLYVEEMVRVLKPGAPSPPTPPLPSTASAFAMLVFATFLCSALHQ